MVSFLTLGILALVSVFVAHQRLSFRRIMLCLAGFLTGAIIGAVPGGCFLIPALTRTGADPFPFDQLLFALICLSGGAAGAVIGVLVADRLTSHIWSPVRAWITAMAGFFIGAIVSAVTLVLLQESSTDVQCGLILSPLAIAAATVAGYSLGVPPK
jgi:hypothetical protein